MRTIKKRMALALGAVVAAIALASAGSEPATAAPNTGGGGSGCVACQYDAMSRAHICEDAELFGYSKCDVYPSFACPPGGSCPSTKCVNTGTRCGVFYPSLTEVPLL